MTKRIKNIVSQVEFYLGKSQAGYHAPDVICRELNTESLNIFREYISEYAITRQISEYLQPFLKQTAATTIPETGILPKPTGFEHEAGMYLEDGTEIELLETGFFIPRLKHPNKAPSTGYPIARMVGSNIEFAPKVPGQKVVINYFALPTQVVYATDSVDEEYVYNDTNSVDWEWTQQLTDKIVLKTLSNFGIELKDGQLINYSEAQNAQR